MQAKYDVTMELNGASTRYEQVHNIQASDGVIVLECQGVTLWVPLGLITAPVQISRASVVR